MSEPDPKGSPFWRFSLKLYRQGGVADACIALQEGAGVDVNLLLFLLWQAMQGRAFTASDVGAIEGRVGPWREAAVIPLRGVRRALKTPPALLAPGTAEAFRTRIKAVELEAERLQQEAMHELAQAQALPGGQEAASAEAAARANVAAYAAMLGATFPAAAVETLLGAFLSTDPGV